MEIFERLYVGDVVLMRKPHPCGGLEWQIVRVGADIGLMCLTCRRRVMVPRREFARAARRFVRRGPDFPDAAGTVPPGGKQADDAT